ncbi:co-chaperone DjlA [Aliikangiella coralliicola]|uniref:Co-chaperone protein DjlA n=1 Tax=Aliikangiella coralliicola TaxID=2592383 RepID=A0A545UEB0_9GAMM|nr:co-chaperone DjlA [Aliikangiella coralliicola]TQV87723.1 co-chaperone DjlA [Aliikangiella coralliicola]
MKIAGKIICGVLGFLIGNIPGLIVGIWLGHSFDKGMDQDFDNIFSRKDPSQTQAVFFEASFAVMGHLAKADGVVTKKEIDVAEQVMHKLGLVGERRQQAIDAFNRGKSNNFDLSDCLYQLKLHGSKSPSLIQMFIEIQIVSATADGQVSQPEMLILYRIGEEFRIPKRQIEQLVEMVIAQQSFHRDGRTGQYSSTSGPSIEQAYKVLGVSADSGKQEVKRAYRKLMSQHHPDKLVAKGMPEEMVKVATEKSQEIQSAYEMIKSQKGF